jgi:hypothetical protein
MIDLIRQHALAAAEAGDWSSVASTLNGLTRVEPITKHWTLGDITALPGGMELAAGIASALVAKGAEGQPDSALFQSVFVAMSTTGVQLHTAERQAIIEAAANGKFPPEAVAAIKSLGQKVTPVLDTPATAESAKAAWDDSLDAEKLSAIRARVINATALANERMTIDQTDEERAAVWSQAWTEGV